MESRSWPRKCESVFEYSPISNETSTAAENGFMCRVIEMRSVRGAEVETGVLRKFSLLKCARIKEHYGVRIFGRFDIHKLPLFLSRVWPQWGLESLPLAEKTLAPVPRSILSFFLLAVCFRCTRLRSECPVPVRE